MKLSKFQMELYQDDLRDLLLQRPGLQHLKVRRRGETLTIYSGQPGDTCPHAKYEHLGNETWGLSLPRHNGRWDPLPVSGALEEVTETLLRDFGFVLDDPRLHSQ
jgi:hypothetical protein